MEANVQSCECAQHTWRMSLEQQESEAWRGMQMEVRHSEPSGAGQRRKQGIFLESWKVLSIPACLFL